MKKNWSVEKSIAMWKILIFADKARFDKMLNVVLENSHFSNDRPDLGRKYFTLIFLSKEERGGTWKYVIPHFESMGNLQSIKYDAKIITDN